MRKLRTLIYICATCALWSCANRGVGPQGGPKDETPPKVLKEAPLNGSVDFHEQEITLQFDEYVQLNDVANQVLISPPQKKTPIVKAVGKKVVVSFEEPLRDSTTYSIDFGSAICDNNERNPIENYVFSFSTGPVIDTMEVSGTLINAENLNPVSGIYVGLHSDLSDTVLSTIPFRHIARTNAEGKFCIRNVHPGEYHLFALDDASKDFLYQPGEGLAFLDTILVPTIVDSIRIDTIRGDSLATDSTLIFAFDSTKVLRWDSAGTPLTDRWDSLTTVHVRYDTVRTWRYEPSNVVLRFFTENKQRHYFQRCNREEQHCFKLLFSAPQDSLPTIRWNYCDSLPRVDSSAFIIQQSPNLDTLTVWIVDSAYIRQDTLQFEMTYQMTDSLNNLVPNTDTISAIYRAPRLSEKAKALLEKNKKTPVLDVKSNASNSFEIYSPLLLKMPSPVASYEPDSMHFFVMVDTIKKALPFMIEKVDSSSMVFALRYNWQPEQSYVLNIDSAAFTDIYGVSSNKQQFKWKIRSLEEYSTLILKLEPFDSTMMIQVLSEKDVPVRTLRATEAGAKFDYLKPASYYVRVYQDINGDSVWTTGDYQKHLQPEPVYYYPQKLTLRANWDFEETVRYMEKDILEQKPEEIRKAGNQKKK